MKFRVSKEKLIKAGLEWRGSSAWMPDFIELEGEVVGVCEECKRGLDHWHSDLGPAPKNLPPLPEVAKYLDEPDYRASVQDFQFYDINKKIDALIRYLKARER